MAGWSMMSMACAPASIQVTDVANPIEVGSDTGDSDSDTPLDSGDFTDTDLPAPVADPTLPGPYSVHREPVTLALSDHSVEGQFTLPKSGGRWPLLILNHAFNTDHRDYRTWADHLASHGFVVLAPTWDEGLLSSRNHAELAQDLVDVLDWLDTTGAGIAWLADHTDPSLIGVLGHSRGGKQAVHAAILDDRIDALFAFDPVDSAPPFGPASADAYPSVTPEMMAEFIIPSAILGAGLSSSAPFIGPACAPEEENYQAYFDAIAVPKRGWVLPKAGHLDFSDPCADDPGLVTCQTCTIGDDPAEARRVAQVLAVSFFQVHLRGDERYADWLDNPSEFSVLQIDPLP